MINDERIYTLDELISMVSGLEGTVIMPGDFYGKYKEKFGANVISGVYRENEPIAKEVLDYVIDYLDEMTAEDRYGAIPIYMKSSQAEEDKK